ncbi:hypothetical protein AB6A40_005478 [Gnathostoma spinigerum]|uniref:Protein Red n=1 Tax=Gnathostoma spinigerum TaxID=75299 RepID=A0ABD6EN70_9BILA
MEEELNALLKDVASTGRSSSISVTGSALRNEDFRQLLNRKAAAPSANNATLNSATHSFSHRQANESKKNHSSSKTKKQKEQAAEDEEDDDDYGASNLTEILKKYRDRAEERRKGLGKDEMTDELAASNAYRAVPSDIRATADAAQRRKQAIQESKYLGGDMEHTHLVKGLDYSLLHKVRSEIAAHEKMDENNVELQFKKDQQIDEPQSENRMVRGIHRILFHSDPPIRNEMFRKGRMAYVVDLEEEENDLPTTLLRSVHDCPVTESTHDLNANNLLIQKLTQILSYLRADGPKKKKKVEFANESERNKHAAQAIYEDETEEYAPSRRPEKDRQKDRKRSKNRSYFDENFEKDRDRERERERDRYRDRRSEKERSRDDRGRDDRDRLREKDDYKQGEYDRRREEIVKVPEKLSSSLKKKKTTNETDAYAECYPGGLEMYDAAGESDDEADYSKMDMGNRRGPVKRWDFEDHAEYEKYMESKEAMPKAAYQFGVKTNDGRKTRKSGPDREKHKLDKEFAQINKILEKRKSDGHASDVAKRIRY